MPRRLRLASISPYLCALLNCLFMLASVSALMLSTPILTCSRPLRWARSRKGASLQRYEGQSADQRSRSGTIASINSIAWLRLPTKLLSPKKMLRERQCLISSMASGTGRHR